jgi:gluconolactonase
MLPLLALSVALSQTAPAAPASPAAPPPAAPAIQPGIEGILAAGTEPKRVVSNRAFTEGPAADPTGTVYFTDIPAGQILRIDPAAKDGAIVFATSDQGCNGLMFSKDASSLYACGMQRGGLVRIDPTSATVTVLTERAGEAGGPLLGANDLAVDAAGNIWFTVFRRPPEGGVPTGIYFFRPGTDSEARLVSSAVPGPNGILLSADGSTLYVLSWAKPELWAYPVKGVGELGDGTLLTKLVAADGSTPRGGGDGLAADSAGNLYLTVPGAKAVQVIGKDGTLKGHIAMPEAPSNCAFGGADGSTLYVTARTSVYTVPTLVPGTWLCRTQPAAAPAPGGARPGS